jgi:hypothetical protein
MLGGFILQIREQLNFIVVVDPRAARSKKLKGKALAKSTDGAILDTLRSGLWFKHVNSLNLQFIFAAKYCRFLGTHSAGTFRNPFFVTMFKLLLLAVLLL